MRKIYLLLIFTICLISISSVKVFGKEFEGRVLTIYNVEDYISQGQDGYVDIIGNFEEEYGVTVNYYTYDTNETMYNQFTLQKEGTYDLVCTSDYMIQKMIKEDLIMPMDDYEENIPYYDNYASPALRQKLKEMEVTKPDGSVVNLDEYAVGYMWGTLGIVYDPECSDTVRDDVKSWDVFWDPQYNNLISIKNSIRDAFVVGLMHKYSKDQAYIEIMNNYLENPTFENKKKYQELVQEVFDFKLDGSDASDQENREKIQNVKEELISLKDNIFGFEVDSGKNDIITGKIKMNVAYSGDAVYSIDTASANGKTLEYYVPEDGSNIWYDAWTLPKGADKELAYLFLDYLSNPVNAADNMNYIGYTPYIVGDELFTLAGSWYGATDFSVNSAYYAEDETMVIYNGELYCCIQDKDAEDEIYPTNEEYFENCEYDAETEYFEGDMVSYNGEIYNCIYYNEANEEEGTIGTINDPNSFEKVEGYDLTFLFEGTLSEGRRAIIYPYLGSENILKTQYPDENIIARCAIMNDFGSYNDEVVIMWGQVKAYTDMTPVYIFLGVFVTGTISLAIYYLIKKKINDSYKQ